MSLNIDPTEDFAAIVDATETVTLRRRGSVVSVVISRALRRAVNQYEARVRNRYNTWKAPAGDGHHTASDVIWHLPQAQLDVPPALGDVVIDAADQRWTVLDVQWATLKTRWRCLTRNLAVTYGLDDTITILRAQYSKGSAGALQCNWHVWRTGIRARIQPAEADIDTHHQARQTSRRVQIFLESDVPLDHHHRIEGPDGTLYRIRSTLGAGRIDQLQTVDAEVCLRSASS